MLALTYAQLAATWVVALDIFGRADWVRLLLKMLTA